MSFKRLLPLYVFLTVALLSTSATADVVVFRPTQWGHGIITPPQWNESSNTVACIGSGGGGASGNTSATQGGSGGGGGGGQVLTNAYYEGWISALWQKGGAGGTPGNPGSGSPGPDAQTQITLSYGGGLSCGGFGGNAGNGTTPGTGGSGTFHGGAGGLGGADVQGMGSCAEADCAGGGGGGAGAAATGTNGSKFVVSTTNGGAGGQGNPALGGAGGLAGANAGANGIEYGPGYGAGGGGGGGNTGTNGGDGGQCGAGGGGAGDNAHSGGNGQDACVIMVYTPTNDINLGYSGANSTSHSDVQNLECNSWTAPITGVGQTIFYSLHNSFTGHLILGIYDSDNNVNQPYFPGTPLAQTAQITNPSSGLHSAALTTNLTVIRGHLYWECFLGDNTIVWDSSSHNGTDLQIGMSYTTTFPNEVSGNWGTAQDTHQKIYVPITSGLGMPNPFLGKWF